MNEDKAVLLEEVKEYINGVESFIIVNYNSGFVPEVSWELSKLLKKDEEAFFEVMKKRILVKAFTNIELSLDQLQGKIGVFFIKKDFLKSVKNIYAFNKEHENLFSMIMGNFEGDICTSAELEELSNLPSKDQLRSEFLSILEAPMTQTVGVMNCLLTSVINCIENKEK